MIKNCYDIAPQCLQLKQKFPAVTWKVFIASTAIPSTSVWS